SLQPTTRRQAAGAWHEPGAPVSVSQIQVQAGTAEEHPGLAGSGQDRPAARGRAGARLAGGRLCPPSFPAGRGPGILLWAGVAELRRQGRLEIVLRAGWAELAAPVLMALVVAAGICERIWPAEPRPVLARGHVQDACYLALHAIVVIPLMTLLSVGSAALI